MARYRGDTGEIQARYRGRLEDGGELVEGGEIQGRYRRDTGEI